MKFLGIKREPIIFEGEDGDFRDLRIPIRTHERAKDGGWTIVAGGSHDGKKLTLNLRLRPDMRPGFNGDEIDTTAFYRNGAVLESFDHSGPKFAELFSKYYGSSLAATNGFLKQILLTTFALDGDPRELASQHLNFKVFHDDKGEMGLYFEMFLHVDLANGFIRLDEKDEEYRSNVIKSFAMLESAPA